MAITSINSAYNATNKDNIILCDGNAGSFTLNIPSAVGINGRKYTIKKIDSSHNSIEVVANSGAENIDGGTAYILKFQYDYIIIVSDGKQWYIIGSN